MSNINGEYTMFAGNTAAQKPPKKPFYKKWWFWVIVAVIVIGGLSSEKDGGASTTVTPTGQTNQSAANQQSTTPVTTVPATTADPYYYIGDVINANGLEISLVSAEAWESDNMFDQPEDGYRYIRMYISVKNVSSTDRYFSSYEFSCYVDGKKEDGIVLTGDKIVDSGELSSGRSTEGYVYFAVPVNGQEIEIEYETSIWTG